ncbi:MAG: hypothetical protein K0R54_752 [Clostridiaceae bacterium]|jgi:hypothetical protein|nr:hypothetical protein [Clostridiaceae bacterium]
MFSSEQKFEINGKTKEDLKTAIECALKLSDYEISGFKYDENRLIFAWMPKNEDNYNGFTRYPFKISLDMATQIAWDYIRESEQAKLRLQEIENLDIDGSIYEGWRIFVPKYYGNDAISNCSYSIIGVEPDLIYYAK